jgi:hypothetical protein
MSENCEAITSTGSPCGWRGPVHDTPDGPRCPNHDPSRRAELRAQAQAGGRARGGPAINPLSLADWPLPHGRGPVTADECDTVASWAVLAVATGKLDPKVSREIAVMINAKLRASKEGKLAERVRELETLLAKLQASSPKKR